MEIHRTPLLSSPLLPLHTSVRHVVHHAALATYILHLTAQWARLASGPLAQYNGMQSWIRFSPLVGWYRMSDAHAYLIWRRVVPAITGCGRFLIGMSRCNHHFLAGPTSIACFSTSSPPIHEFVGSFLSLCSVGIDQAATPLKISCLGPPGLSKRARV